MLHKILYLAPSLDTVLHSPTKPILAGGEKEEERKGRGEREGGKGGGERKTQC